ncbi:MAG: hypothetical protein WAM85_17400 [Terracidiphilus sp.]
MRKDIHKDPFKAAYDQASSQLVKIDQKCEQLRLERDRVERVVKLLKPASELDEVVDGNQMTPASDRAGFTVITHFTVVHSSRNAGA